MSEYLEKFSRSIFGAEILSLYWARKTGRGENCERTAPTSRFGEKCVGRGCGLISERLEEGFCQEEDINKNIRIYFSTLAV